METSQFLQSQSTSSAWSHLSVLSLESEYGPLYDVLNDLGWYLVTDPHAYAQAHYLPNYYSEIEKLSALTRWTWGTDLDEAWEVAQELEPPPYAQGPRQVGEGGLARLLPDSSAAAPARQARPWRPPVAPNG